MGGRSPAPAERGATFSRARLALGVVLVTVLGGAALVGLSRFAEGPHPGSLVYVSGSGLVFRDLASGEEEVVLPWGEGWSSPALSRDGAELAYASGDGVGAFDLATGEDRTVAPDGAPVAFDPEGRVVYERPASGGRSVLFREAGDDPEPLVPDGYGGREGPVLWASADRYAARILDPDGSGALLVVDLSRGAPAVVHAVRGAFPLTISPDGREVLYATGVPGRLRVLDLEELESRDLAFTGELVFGATSPQGVAAVGGRDADGDPATWALRGGEKEPKRLADVRPDALAWARDSSRLFLSSDGGLFEVPVPDGRAEALDAEVEERRFLEVVR